MNNMTCKRARAITGLYVIQMGYIFEIINIKAFPRGAFFQNLRAPLWNSKIDVQSKNSSKKYIFSWIELGNARLYARFPAKSEFRNGPYTYYRMFLYKF